jgi:hypothetical protein
MEFAGWIRDQWDRVLAGVAGVAGAVLLVVGWVQTSRALYPGQQLPYIVSAGLGGLFLLGVSATVWLSADLRDEWRKLDRVEETFADVSTRLARLEAVGAAGEAVPMVPGSSGIADHGELRLSAVEESARR